MSGNQNDLPGGDDFTGPVWAAHEEKMPDWPSLEDGSPEPSAMAATAKNEMDYQMKLAFLRSEGIPAFGQVPNTAFFSKVLFGGAILGEDIIVPVSHLEEARALLADFDAATPLPDDDEADPPEEEPED